jgi:hypothetical protein
MTNMVTINGASVDADDPCALYQALYAAKLALIAGERVEETEIRSPVSQNRVRVSVGSMEALNAEIMKLAAACQAKTSGKRARFAKGISYGCTR